MKFEQIKDESSEGFRRLTGIKYTTFDVMVKILGEAEAVLKAQGGKPNKVSIENRLLMALEYLREYRTYFHISRSYGISESTCYRNIRWVEDTLIKDGAFSLPGRKALLKSDVDYEVVLIDATETPIERPKKNKNISTQARRKNRSFVRLFLTVSVMILNYLRSQVFIFIRRLKALRTRAIKAYMSCIQTQNCQRKKQKRIHLQKKIRKIIVNYPVNVF